MKKSRRYGFLLACILTPLLAACYGDKTTDGDKASATQERMPQKKQVQNALTVYKSPTCGCCGEWISHIESEGFSAVAQDSAEVNAFKEQHGISPRYSSCHTAVTDSGYVFEGHVPAKYIRQFLTEAPDDAIGLAVPGMPVGSPGMEIEDKFEPYDVMLLKKDGSAEVYAAVSTPEQQY